MLLSAAFLIIPKTPPQAMKDSTIHSPTRTRPRSASQILGSLMDYCKSVNCLKKNLACERVDSSYTSPMPYLCQNTLVVSFCCCLQGEYVVIRPFLSCSTHGRIQGLCLLSYKCQSHLRAMFQDSQQLGDSIEDMRSSCSPLARNHNRMTASRASMICLLAAFIFIKIGAGIVDKTLVLSHRHRISKPWPQFIRMSSKNKVILLHLSVRNHQAAAHDSCERI